MPKVDSPKSPDLSSDILEQNRQAALNRLLQSAQMLYLELTEQPNPIFAPLLTHLQHLIRQIKKTMLHKTPTVSESSLRLAELSQGLAAIHHKIRDIRHN